MLKKVNKNKVAGKQQAKSANMKRMKAEFISLVSHQLREPLTTIKWFVELLQTRNLDREQKEYIDGIGLSNERAIRMVNDLLNLARIETGRNFEISVRLIDVIPVIKETIAVEAALAKKKSVRVVLDKSCRGKVLVQADEEKIHLAFQNIIANAVHYSFEGGKVTIGYKKEAKQVVFFIKDEGIGIGSEDKKMVFQKFFRAKSAIATGAEGTGLGLYIAKTVIDGHHGKIWLESHRNKGTTVFISLPR